MPKYRVTLAYSDGERRIVEVNANDPADARQKVRDMALAQLRAHDFGGDKSAGMPTVHGGEKV